MRSWKQLVPNSLTAANMFCGFYAILAAIGGRLDLAAWLIVVAGIFDLFDGRVARLLNASSEFGEHFDTLSDQLSFGLAPAILTYQLFAQLGAFIGRETSSISLFNKPVITGLCFFYAMCVAFRLARFSVKSAKGAEGFFQGLSSPVSAATLAGLVLNLLQNSWQNDMKVLTLALGCFFLGGLMASSLKFPSFKEVNWKGPKGITILCLFFGGIALVIFNPNRYLVIGFGVFICSILTWNLQGLILTGGANNFPRKNQ